MAASKIKLAYLASGGGSSVANLVSMIQDGRLEGFASRVVLCDKREGKAGIYDRREHLGIPVLYAPTEQRQLKTLKVYQPDLILGLGFVKKVGDRILEQYKNRVLNIHPTLLPKHGGKDMYGLATHMSVLESGDEYTGPTVHIMNSEFDEGRILRQVTIPVPKHLVGKPTEENAHELQQYVLQEEYKIMPDVLERIRDRVIGDRVIDLDA